jgi:hypothetical protein
MDRIDIARALLASGTCTSKEQAIDKASFVIGMRNQRGDIRAYLRLSATAELSDQRAYDYLANAQAEAEAKADQATAYRPSYAPAGKLTSSEQGARALASNAREDMAWYIIEVAIESALAVTQ